MEFGIMVICRVGEIFFHAFRLYLHRFLQIWRKEGSFLRVALSKANSKTKKIPKVFFLIITQPLRFWNKHLFWVLVFKFIAPDTKEFCLVFCVVFSKVFCVVFSVVFWVVFWVVFCVVFCEVFCIVFCVVFSIVLWVVFCKRYYFCIF